ncbi:hemolysin-activating ACP:hemolysin acyltransferase [Bradyrhizobium japonicum]
MSDADMSSQESREHFLKSLDKAQIGAAASKLFAASIGDMVVVLSRSPAHKHSFLADIEWMVLPPVAAGQFYIAEAMHKENGFRAPVAVATWALVSEEVDLWLQQQNGARRLRPDQWKCGEIAWLIDVAGSTEGVHSALQWLAAEPFKERSLKMVMRSSDGISVTTLDAALAKEADSLAVL